MPFNIVVYTQRVTNTSVVYVLRYTYMYMHRVTENCAHVSHWIIDESGWLQFSDLNPLCGIDLSTMLKFIPKMRDVVGTVFIFWLLYGRGNYVLLFWGWSGFMMINVVEYKSFSCTCTIPYKYTLHFFFRLYGEI